MQKISTKTKIVCTLSNERTDEKLMRELIKSGMNVIRMNFSHMSKSAADEIIKNVVKLRNELKTPIAIMLDTKGPEVRIYGYDKPVVLKKDDLITIQSYNEDDIETKVTEKEKYFYTNLANIGKYTKQGSKILLMDGYIEGKIVEKENDRIIVDIKNGGEIRLRAHLSIPNIDYPVQFLSPKDIEDITYAVNNELDYIALSFVRSAEDISKVKNLIRGIKEDSDIKLIAKLENKQAVNNIDDIIHHSHGIMVARGDLGVEIDLEDVPVIQKKIIEKCYTNGKVVITATQMLESMIENPVPTRAEASDVANACYDMTSAVMLSGETAIGKFPALVVATMQRIIKKAEDNIEYNAIFKLRTDEFQNRDLTSVISYNAIATAYQCQATSIIAFTKSGFTARMISKFRPGLPIIAFTFDKKVYNQLAMNWGVYPFMLKENEDFETMLSEGMEFCLNNNLVKRGDLSVVVAGLPLGGTGRTNNIRIVSLGRSRIPAKLIHLGDVTATVVHVYDETDIQKKSVTGKIVFLKNFKKEYIPYLRNVAGVVMEDDEYENDLLVIGMAYNIPVMINAFAAMELLKDGVTVEIDSAKQLLIEV
ncbi:MAG: pyruvate kinase [Candidatus Cloacimonetes bacterium]|nr:pyruvate kinase [Candidatus Cloacimonadota bacterium]